MVIYLKHPKHGAKVAICDMEAVADETNGWTRYTLDKPEEEVAPVVNTLEVKRRRGRPVVEVVEQGA